MPRLTPLEALALASGDANAADLERARRARRGHPYRRHVASRIRRRRNYWRLWERGRIDTVRLAALLGGTGVDPRTTTGSITSVRTHRPSMEAR